MSKRDTEPIEDCGNPEIPSTMSKPPKDWYKKDWSQIATIKVAVCSHLVDKSQCAFCQKMPFTTTPLTPDCSVIGGQTSNLPLSWNVSGEKYSASAWQSLLAQNLASLSTTR
jgi:hypothetical protein